MADQKKPQKKPYTVTSAFVWDKGIRKPGDTVELTDSEAYGLKKRGKVEEPKAKRGAKKTADPATSDPAAASA